MSYVRIFRAVQFKVIVDRCYYKEIIKCIVLGLICVDSIVISVLNDYVVDINCVIELFDVVVLISDYFNVVDCSSRIYIIEGKIIDFVICIDVSIIVVYRDVGDNVRVVVIVIVIVKAVCVCRRNIFDLNFVQIFKYFIRNFVGSRNGCVIQYNYVILKIINVWIEVWVCEVIVGYLFRCDFISDRSENDWCISCIFSNQCVVMGYEKGCCVSVCICFCFDYGIWLNCQGSIGFNGDMAV